MKLVELAKMHRELLDLISKFGLNIKDCQYTQLYYDYALMRDVRGEKYEYTIQTLAKKYGISVSKIKRLINIFKQPIDQD